MNDLATHYREQGYAIVRRAYDAPRVDRLLKICERVHAQWKQNPLTDNPPVGPDANYMRHLNHPDYHRQHPDDLTFLLDACAEPKLLDAVDAALNEDFLFFNTSFYFNPSGQSLDGHWHKDSGDDPTDPRDVATGMGLQLQIPLVPSDDLELVPGSQARDYSPTERHICLDDNRKHNRSNDMPGALRLTLEPGDAVLFNPFGIHRGRYHADKRRRTFMLSFNKKRLARQRLDREGLNQYTNQPWFLHSDYLNGVKDRTRQLFGDYIELYGPHWRSQLCEIRKYASLIDLMKQNNHPNPFFETSPRGTYSA